jgi:hypothetical protein
MGYFSNGTEGDMYEEEYCYKCLNFDEEKGCPIMNLHLVWNYEAISSKGDAIKKYALDWFIPPNKDGMFNQQCRMFKEEE